MKEPQATANEHRDPAVEIPRVRRMQAGAFGKTLMVVPASCYDALEARVIEGEAESQRRREKHRTTWSQVEQHKNMRELAERNGALLAQALGECLVEAGITRPDASLSGPDLLMFAQDLKRHLSQQTIKRRMPERAEFEGIHGGHQMRTQGEADAYNAALAEVSRLNTSV